MTKTLIDLDNHMYIQSTTKVKHLCKPLMETLPVNFFYFERGYHNRKRIILSSNKDWLKDYFLHKHHDNELINFHEKIKNEHFIMSVWGHCKNTDHASCQFWYKMKEKYNFANYFWLTWVYDKYVEVYGFAVESGIDHPIQCFLYNQDIFLHFAEYFSSKGYNLLEEAENHKFQVAKPNDMSYSNQHIYGIPENDRKKYYTTANVNKIQLKGDFKGVTLSRDEAKTMILLCQGMKYSDIANELFLTEPTIKYRIGSVREKLKAKNKKELIDLFNAHQLLELCQSALGLYDS